MRAGQPLSREYGTHETVKARMAHVRQSMATMAHIRDSQGQILTLA